MPSDWEAEIELARQIRMEQEDLREPPRMFLACNGQHFRYYRPDFELDGYKVIHLTQASQLRGIELNEGDQLREVGHGMRGFPRDEALAILENWHVLDVRRQARKR